MSIYSNPNQVLLFFIVLLSLLLTGCTEQNDNQAYLEYELAYSEVILYDIECLSSAADAGNLIEVEYWGQQLKDDSKEYLDGVDQFEISDRLEKVRSEQKQAAGYLNKAGSYAESGARTYNVVHIGLAADYMKKAVPHTLKAAEYLGAA